ncbi:hypothetical protein [Cohnella sp. REN36]|uniref:AAA family ATPase n=1 Tax=Cohnella sp. REN36 TaxID=2887347 RepID=UPI001D155F7F|nr:hypothetical protein [Cohnella sp. REN36]MCC3374230.1 hypothetical protein [Cohnella sp. REN36]
MSRHLIEIINDCGLKYVRSHNLGQYEVFEATHRVENMAFGLYLLAPMTGEQFLDISRNTQSYTAFEEQLLAPFYFRLKGDWSWNLYLYIIINKNEIQNIPIQYMGRVERSKKYGKKLVVSLGELADRLPAAKIPSRMSGKIAVDPFTEWMSALAPLELDFCLFDFKESNLDAYVKGGEVPHHRSDIIPSRQESDNRPVGPIKSVSFGSMYRSHLLSAAPDLDFVQVNLFYGPNGMGKTSVLEGIELSFTGAIQRNLLAKAPEPEQWDGRLTFGDAGVFDGIPEEAERKEREIFYYKHKVSRHGRSQINRVFHQYNYFSSEAVHQFCYNFDSRSDYRKDFARVIYGEQLERVEQLWTRYSSEFGKQYNRLSRRIEELNSECESIGRQGVQRSTVMRQRAASAVRNMTQWIAYCQYSYPTLEEDTSTDIIDEWLQHLTPRLQQLDIISRPLFLNSEIDDKTTLQTAIRSMEAKMDDFLSQRNSYVQRLQQLPGKEELDRAITEEHNRKNSLVAANQRLAKSTVELEIHRALYEQPDMRKRRTELELRRKALTELIMALDDMLVKCRWVSETPLLLADPAQAEAQLSVLQTRFGEAEQDYKQTSERVEENTRRFNRLERLVADLKTAGWQYLHEHPDETRCPLCGHDHEDHALIVVQVERGLMTENNLMTELVNEHEAKRVAVARSSKELAAFTEQVESLRRFVEVYQYLVSRQALHGVALSSTFTPEAVRVGVSQLSERITDVRNDLKVVEKEIFELEAAGCTLKAIQDLERLLRNELAAFVHEESYNGSVDQLLNVIRVETEGQQRQIDEIDVKIAELQTRIQSIMLEKTTMESKLELIEIQRNENSVALLQLGKAEQALAALYEHNITFNEKRSWTEWRSYLEKLLAEAEALRQILEPAILTEQNNQRLAALQYEVSQLTTQKSRCEHAVTALSHLQSLAKYGDEFVRANFEAISRLFVALHAPNEFVSLELTSDNELVAIRKGQETRCAIYQMSTGQRTAVALSIFFVMHLVMDSAPQFLMLDEPVANLDELNALGLLDFLRQLTVTNGTQIFFTTANPQVATLFRRKFSFFKNNFRSYHFQRFAEGPLQIQLQQFQPQQERAVHTVRLNTEEGLL